jgi:AcrR family transcriptional regulator
MMRAFAQFFNSHSLTRLAAMPEPSLRPRKAPQQARASATVETILQAATRVLSSGALAGFTTNRIAEVAGVSVGSLYQYFPNKAALVAALIERAQTSLADAIEQSCKRSQGQPLATLLAGLVDVAIEHQFGNALLAAALDHEEQRLPLQEVLNSAQSRIVKAVRAALHKHPELAGAPVSPAAAADCLTIAKALIETEAAQTHPALADLRKRVLRALHGYLLLGSDSKPQRVAVSPK